MRRRPQSTVTATNGPVRRSCAMRPGSRFVPAFPGGAVCAGSISTSSARIPKSTEPSDGIAVAGKTARTTSSPTVTVRKSLEVSMTRPESTFSTPIKRATNEFAGLRKTSAAEPLCMTAPSRRTRTLSASVMASLRSWLTKIAGIASARRNGFELVAQLIVRLGIERGKRLVEQKQVGGAGECAGERDALLLAGAAARPVARFAR